ncbi:MAG: helix-turn-helix transcriptional regulator [Clostridiaceae bacterium]|nr:helix-turn-helix transcriptional regulator [Clostridiaceae bacterium]
MKVNEKIKDARKAAGLTQKQLAEKLGVSAAMVAQYENGHRLPKVQTLKKIAYALNINVSDLLDDLEQNTLNPVAAHSTENGAISKDAFLSMFKQVMEMEHKPASAEDLKKAKLIIKIPEDLKHNLVAAMDKITDPRDSDLIRMQLLNCYDNRLNDNGKAEALKRVEELAEIKKYSQVPDSDTHLTTVHDKPEVQD